MAEYACQVMADMKKVYDDLININLYNFESIPKKSNVYQLPVNS